MQLTDKQVKQIAETGLLAYAEDGQSWAPGTGTAQCLAREVLEARAEIGRLRGALERMRAIAEEFEPRAEELVAGAPPLLVADASSGEMCLHTDTVRVGVVGNRWCSACGAVTEPIGFGLEPRWDQWTYPGPTTSVEGGEL